MNNEINIYGNAQNMQIQQDSSESKQTITNSDIDYHKIEEVLQEINKHKDLINSELSEYGNQFCDALNDALEELDGNKNPSKLKQALSIMKDIIVNAGGGLVTAGILSLIQSINF